MQGDIIDANPAFLEMFGVDSLDELKAHRTSDFVRAEVREREMAQLERDGSVRDIEFQLTRRDGEVRTVVTSLSDYGRRRSNRRQYHSQWE